jgi:hypothetical protein
MWQSYHYSYWAVQPTPLLRGDAALALHVEASPPIPIAGDREVFCLGGIPEPSADEDFSPELMTG